MQKYRNRVYNDLLYKKTEHSFSSKIIYLKKPFLQGKKTVKNVLPRSKREPHSPSIPLFLKWDGGVGEGRNFFSREKKFRPSPASTPSTLQITVRMRPVMMRVLKQRNRKARDCP
jgi:hypothetical protein